MMRGFRRLGAFPFIRVLGFRPVAALSKPHVFEDFVFREEQPLRRNVRLVIEVTRDGVLHGVFFFLRLHFGESSVLDTWHSHTTWATPFVRFKTPTAVKRGDRVELGIQSDLSENPTYSLEMLQQENGSARLIGRYAWAGD
jgi:hypothetical protein